MDAIDPDTIERAVATRQVSAEIAADEQKKEACRPFDNPDSRRLLTDIKRRTEIRIDTISTDSIISSGYDAARATIRSTAAAKSSPSTATISSRAGYAR